MNPHTRALIAAAAHAAITGGKVAGVYDHAASRHLKIAAERRGDRLQAFDGERSANLSGTLPDLYDDGDAAFISLEIDGMTARGYDRGSGGFYIANVTDRLVQLYDYSESAWFAFAIQTNEDGSTATS